MRFRILFLFLTLSGVVSANSIFIPMDEKQTDHLKAYGIAYWILKNNIEVDSVGKLISKPLKEKLKCDAINLNFLKRTSRAKLLI